MQTIGRAQRPNPVTGLGLGILKILDKLDAEMAEALGLRVVIGDPMQRLSDNSSSLSDDTLAAGFDLYNGDLIEGGRGELLVRR